MLRSSFTASAGIDLEKPRPLHVSVGVRTSVTIGFLCMANINTHKHRVRKCDFGTNWYQKHYRLWCCLKSDCQLSHKCSTLHVQCGKSDCSSAVAKEVNKETLSESFTALNSHKWILQQASILISAVCLSKKCFAGFPRLLWYSDVSRLGSCVK